MRILTLIVAMTVCGGVAKPQAALWSNDFEKVEVGGEPEGVLSLSGEFTVQKEGDNKVLELPGAPLETMGLVLGPAKSQGVTIACRIHGEKTARRYPSFGVGLCGAQGYKLMVSPMRDSLELMLDSEVIERVEMKWASGKWTRLRISVTQQADNRWLVAGKAWADGAEEPAEWAVSKTVEQPPPNGGASLWGLPYSGKPIRYDDVVYGEVMK